MLRRTFLQQAAALAAVPAMGTGLSRVVMGQSAPLRVNAERLNGALAQFDRIGRTAGGINRVAYSDADLKGRRFALDLFHQAGLTPRLDTLGNIIARVPGTDARMAPIMIGSHIDSVTDGGNYDGPVGSFSAIEVARSLAEQRVRLRHPLDVVVWQNEEGGTVGSQGFIGLLKPEDLSRVARSGKTLREGIKIIGGDPDRIAESVKRKGDVACYIELHIEQGGLLERGSRQIGVVEGIVGLRWFEVTIKGFSNHAGTTPMDQRQDAMLAAARFTVAVNEAIRSEPGRQVATVGRMNVTPNTTNVIPGQVVMTIDLRDIDGAKLDRFDARFRQMAKEIGEATRTEFSFAYNANSQPALSDPRVMDIVQASATSLQLTHQRMPSGAGHDAQEVAHIAPMGMIFVPSVGGISHSPREFTKADDITNGANVLLNAVIAADRTLG
ncbi:MAG TPA: Zn-dependent hydrolase [Gemmatimonas sp.]|uniref:Zn-dependent hydrolase n=1 Tax=Gemmatimonas sp. TaxID=1962908 RepID=UPI002ED8208E